MTSPDNPRDQLADMDPAALTDRFAVFTGDDLNVLGRVISAADDAARLIRHHRPTVMLVVDGLSVTATVSITVPLSGEGAR